NHRVSKRLINKAVKITVILKITLKTIFYFNREPSFITSALSLETRRVANGLAKLIDCLM
ncbi:hypothetical protein OFC62_23830, partial [Escherichia coli]|nr:hypothetical protein [Escherichia coli]